MRGIKRVQGKKDGFSSHNLNIVAFSSFFLFSCMPNHFHSQDTISHRSREVESTWSGGQCVFSDNSLTYMDNGKDQQATLQLDVRVLHPQRLLCSENYSVIITPTSAVMSLGGEDVLRGHEMLGYVSGRFIPANSIEISLVPMVNEGGFSNERISSDQLSINTRSGRTWMISLSNPFEGWNVF